MQNQKWGIIMKRTTCWFLALLSVMLFCGCVRQHPVLTSQTLDSTHPELQSTPYIPVLTPGADMLDALGLPIEGEEHYLRYLEFRDIRIYEYGDGTFLDAICINSYPVKLEGALDVVFRDSEGIEVARANLQVADGSCRLDPGKNRIYAQINTDMDVQMMDFTFENVQDMLPDIED